MEHRPRLKLTLNSGDKTLELTGWLVLILLWVLTIYNYSVLPERIPIHYNVAGEADAFGHKANIFIMPVLATVLFAGISILNKYPHIFNYPVKISAGNAERQYRLATGLLRFLKLAVTIIFGAVVYKTIQYAKGDTQGLGLLFFMLLTGLTLLPVLYFLIQSFRKQ